MERRSTAGPSCEFQRKGPRATGRVCTGQPAVIEMGSTVTCMELPGAEPISTVTPVKPPQLVALEGIVEGPKVCE